MSKSDIEDNNVENILEASMDAFYKSCVSRISSMSMQTRQRSLTHNQTKESYPFSHMSKEQQIGLAGY